MLQKCKQIVCDFFITDIHAISSLITPIESIFLMKPIKERPEICMVIESVFPEPRLVMAEFINMFKRVSMIL